MQALKLAEDGKAPIMVNMNHTLARRARDGRPEVSRQYGQHADQLGG